MEPTKTRLTRWLYADLLPLLAALLAALLLLKKRPISIWS